MERSEPLSGKKMSTLRRMRMRRKFFRHGIRGMTDSITTHTKPSSQQLDMKMFGNLLDLVLRFSVLQTTDGLSEKLDEAKELISKDQKERAIQILDEAKSKTESLKTISAEAQNIIELQQEQLQVMRNHREQCKRALELSKGDDNVKNSETIPLRQINQNSASIDNDEEERKDVALKKEESSEQKSECQTPSTHPQIPGKSNKTNGNFNSLQCRSEKRLVHKYQSKCPSTSMKGEADTNNDEVSQTADSEQVRPQTVPWTYSRSENNKPVATDEVGHFIQKIRDTVQKKKAQFRNMERENMLLLENAKNERNRSEREINLAWQRYVMDILAMFTHNGLHEHNQLQDVYDDMRRFENIQEYY